MEVEEMQSLINREGKEFKLAAWDWWYYAEKLRKEKYDLDEEELRPYFELKNVRNGLFQVCNNLFGITFEELLDIPKYHEDAQVFEVKEADGSHLGVLYMDFHPRASKRGGAWMGSFRKQYIKDGENITPVITTVFNFSKPTGGKPALLSFEEVSTMFHEMGHALHGLFSDCTYESISGTSVPRDFVELPSSIMENWASAPEVMKMYGKHYETGETIPDELIQKIKNAGHFNQGFVNIEYLSAAFLDMNWHTLKDAKSEIDVDQFESKALADIGLISEIVVRYRSTYFSHIFSGGYSAGYYSYKWSEVLDADAFEAFMETSLYDKETAGSFRENILSRGGTEDPMVLYKRFRGREPSIDPLLKRSGLSKS
jgi:peptidyl-dipeptidase Dcp